MLWNFVVSILQMFVGDCPNHAKKSSDLNSDGEDVRNCESVSFQ